MGLETIALAAIAGGQIFGGIQQSREAGKQANRAVEEAENRMRAEARENIALEKRQKLAFLKSGVALEGSPLLLLSETKRRGQDNLDAIRESGRIQASGLRSSGRQALIGGFTNALGTAAGGFGGGMPGLDISSATPTANPTQFGPPRKPLR